MSDMLVIYHGNCADGFGAAWAVWKLHPDATFFPATYGKEPPDVTGKDVYLVDFSYKREVLEKMVVEAKSLTILDHHKTAMADIQPLLDSGKVRGIFDMEKSGAMITWDWFHPNTPAPTLLHHIQDRDLWKFTMEGTREVQANLFSYPYDFELWDKLMSEDPTKLRADGVAIERKHFKDIEELLKMTRRTMVLGGFTVPVANLPYTLASDAAGKMAEGQPFAACYYDSEGWRNFSLRSRDGGEDVSEVAKKYGGGGHRNAAGFRMPQNWEGE